MHRATPFFAIAILAVIVSTSPSIEASSQTFRFAVSGIEPDRAGTVRCALYDSEKTFLTESVVAATRARAAGDHVECVFEGVPAGVYAATALHDEDDDGEMDTVLGFPTEGYAISRDAHFATLIPQWGNARFRFNGNDARMQARIKY